MKHSVYKGYGIEVSENGVFSAQVDEYTVRGDTLVEARGKIDALASKGVKKTKLALPVLALVRTDNNAVVACFEIRDAILTGAHRVSRKLQYEDTRLDSDGVMYTLPASPENRRRMELYAQAAVLKADAQRTLEARSLAITGRYGRIEPDDYPAVVSELQFKHERFSKEDEPDEESK